MDLARWLAHSVETHQAWEAEAGPNPAHPSVLIDEDRLAEAHAELAERLRNNYPFGHPRFAGQMLKPPHPAAVVGYVSAMLVNPNNHALDGGPATAELEREAVHQLATMFGFDQHLGHLTTSGTIANLEALYVAREIHPGRCVAFSTEAHYTHARMCQVLGLATSSVAVDAAGRMDMTALEELLRTGQVGTVVVTAGTTGLGAVDPIHEALDLARRYDARIHVDAAYGGFFATVAGTGDDIDIAAAPWKAIASCDSVVVDPHKHGLQPYGCGAVIFRDPAVGRFYDHDSPYTYFTSTDLHLGEISLECSRAGAAAAALWFTFRLIPPTVDGLGQIVRSARRAALTWAELIRQSDSLVLYQQPELDIITYFPRTRPADLPTIDSVVAGVLSEGMEDLTDPVFLSTLRVSAEAMAARHPDISSDGDPGRILRSVLMKPEHETFVPQLHDRVVELARGSLA